MIVDSMPSELSRPQYRPDLNGLRAIAVLSVVAFHTFPNQVRGGFVGVDIFFVLSGYLIFAIVFDNLEKETFSFLEFYARRIKRLFPALILTLAACFLFGWFFLPPQEGHRLSKQIAAAAGFVSNFVFWKEEASFDAVVETKPLIHLWSLGIEGQFYLLWPPLFWLVYQVRFGFFIFLSLTIALSFFLNGYGIGHDVTATFYSPQTRYWELLSGSLLAWFTLTQKNRFFSKDLSRICSLFGLGLLAYGIWNPLLPFPGFWALVPVLGTVLVIFAGPHAFANGVLLSNPILVWVGLISYPLYLWHWPLLAFARIRAGEMPGASVRIQAVLISFLLAAVTYRFVERPLRSGKSKLGSPRTLLLLLSVIGALALCSYMNL